MDKIKQDITVFFKDKRRTQWFLVSCVCLLLLIYVMFSNYGIINTLKLQNHQKHLVTAITTEQNARDSLTKRYRLLKRDTLYIEQVAREKYGLVKPSEKVFIIKETDEDQK